MPWCRTCNRMVEEDEVVSRPRVSLGGSKEGPDTAARDRDGAGAGAVDGAPDGAPDGPEEACCPDCGEPFGNRRRAAWHFKLVLAATAVYLGYRTYQGITWLAHHL